MATLPFVGPAVKHRKPMTGSRLIIVASSIAFALFLPRGLWSLVADRLPGPLLPVGYRLRRTSGSTEP